MKRYPMYINGEFVASASGKWFAVYDPSTEEVIAEVADGGAADVERGVAEGRVIKGAGSSTQRQSDRPNPGAGTNA